MTKKIFSIDKNWTAITGNILNESYIIILTGSAIFLVSEIILPGFLSERINFSSIYLLLFFASATLYFSEKLSFGKKPSKSSAVAVNKKILFGFCFLATAFLAIDLKSLNSALFVPIVILAFFSVYSLIRFMFED